MRIHLILQAILLTGLISSCATKEVEPLRVSMFHLKSIQINDDSSQMIRGEQQYRLKGAVTNTERQSRLGQYYTVRWQSVDRATSSLRIVMDYEQAATGAKKLQMIQELPANEDSGTIEFQITGENYRKNGRVLSWRVRLMDGSQIIDEKRSYLWR